VSSAYLSVLCVKVYFNARGRRDTQRIADKKMKKTATLFTFGLMLLFGSASHSAAQVKRVQMHIAGYLCGN